MKAALERAFRAGWEAGFKANDEWAPLSELPVFEQTLRDYLATEETRIIADGRQADDTSHAPRP